MIKDDALANHRMAFVSGPRQVGKTTMSKAILLNPTNYFSWDQTEFRRDWVRGPQAAVERRDKGPILLDEIHKDRKWKTRIKGLYDTLGDTLPIIVTGSARLDIYRKGSDSLLGRYIPYRLHPFSVAESNRPPGPDEILARHVVSYPWDDLLRYGGFPEPFLKAQENFAKRWSRLRLDRLAFEDTRDIKNLSDLNAFRVLLDLIPGKVGSLFSFNSLREDVGVAYATVRDWVLLSEMLYYGFFVRPYSKKIVRAVKAEPKFYLFDILQLSTVPQRLENLAALHLLKACHYWTDVGSGFFDLHFVRNKEKREVDFLITRDHKPWMLVECKSNQKSPSVNLVHFAEALGTPHNYQLVTDSTSSHDREFPAHNIRIMSYQKFMAGLV